MSASRIIVVRQAGRGDGAQIARIHQQNAEAYVHLAPDLFRPPDEDGLIDFLEPGADADTDQTLTLVAEIDGELIGYLEARLVPPHDTARWQASTDLQRTTLFINALGTLPGNQRRGVGSRLVEAAEAWGKTHGAAVAMLDTWIDSPSSMPFWEQRMGYERKSVVFRKLL